MFAGKKSAQIREILISESAWEEMTCLFAPSLRLGDMKKIITPLVDIVLCTYIITTCFICLTEFNNWQNKIIAVTIIIGSAYIIAIALNRLLGTKIGVLSGIFNLLSGPLLIIGAIVCIALLDPWPVKVIGLFLWVIIMFCLPSFINRDKE